MKIVYYVTIVMAFVFLLGETARRGMAYFAVNATTMIEDYLCGALLLVAAWLWHRRSPSAPLMMAVGWAFATGGMFVPFAAHFEAWLRNETFRPDHPHTDVGSIILKGMILAISLACLIVTLRNRNTPLPLLKGNANAHKA
ncbi:hypothetical protein [Rhizobium leguminosarum]|uniref:hypothetical protein n=1 Tax=Rhizobium leguminosarum TaxID=384 RepID=UPI001C91B1EB|nr:hypothetical protein [Rhizobium leguminosarum]MBY3027089.1 hypothetical protein [Rhizobium leguminosarum]